MENKEISKIIADNLVLNLERNEGTKRIGNIRESLRDIRDEIEDFKKCFMEAPEFISIDEYAEIPKTPINLDEIEELKKNSYSETRSENYDISNVCPKKLFDVFLSCDLLEFYTSNKSEEIPVSCQAKTFSDDINFFINLQQSESEKETEITFIEVNPSYIRLGYDCYFIQGESLQKLTKMILSFYKGYTKSLKETDDPARLNLANIDIKEENSFFENILFYVLSFFKDNKSREDYDFFNENLDEISLDCFLKNRKKIVIKKVWA